MLVDFNLEAYDFYKIHLIEILQEICKLFFKI